MLSLSFAGKAVLQGIAIALRFGPINRLVMTFRRHSRLRACFLSMTIVGLN